jgi:hypothetical protein
MKKVSRRDRIYFVGLRAGKLNQIQAAHAWADLAKRLENLGDVDIPKYRDVLHAIRSATITGVKG